MQPLNRGNLIYIPNMPKLNQQLNKRLDSIPKLPVTSVNSSEYSQVE
jgi:hypothetical protein